MRCDRRLERNGERQCARVRGHAGECRSLGDVLGAPLKPDELADIRRRVGHDADRVILDDPDASLLPFGCIHVDALQSLAHAMMRLDDWHLRHDGEQRDRPCLRRLESANGIITAHISSGPAVGGTWARLELVRGKWLVRDA